MPFTDLLSPQDLWSIMLRIGCALTFGALIGWERERRDKPAGLRTHMLVSLGTALFILVPIQLGIAVEDPGTISRVMQGAIAGIGFLGAGEILGERQPKSRKIRIHGLTSAAAIWVSAALGVIAACGLWAMGIIAVFCAWLVLRIVKKIEQMALIHKHKPRSLLDIAYDDYNDDGDVNT